MGGSAAAVPPDTALVPSVLETVPTGTTGDTADDPAIWVNTADPSASLVITNEKVVNRLTVFDLAGHVVQRIAGPSGAYGNVDVRGTFVAASISGIRLWRVNQTGERTPAGRGPRDLRERRDRGEGLCMWDPGTRGLAGGLYAITMHRTTFRVRVHPLTDADQDGLLLVEAPVRDFYLGSEAEGCETNDTTEDAVHRGGGRRDLALRPQRACRIGPAQDPDRTRRRAAGA